MARSLDQTIQYSSVLIIEPYAQETVTSDDRAYTWFKSRLLQILSHPTRQALPLASRLDELSTSLTPTNLLPLSSSDILIIKSGGTLVVDGVEINFANPAFPGFSLRKIPPHENQLHFLATDFFQQLDLDLLNLK